MGFVFLEAPAMADGDLRVPTDPETWGRNQSALSPEDQWSLTTQHMPCGIGVLLDFVRWG
jgi:hypothetical protein